MVYSTLIVMLDYVEWWPIILFIVKIIFFMLRQPPVGHGLRIFEASRSHPDTPQWMRNQPDAQTST